MTPQLLCLTLQLLAGTCLRQKIGEDIYQGGKDGMQFYENLLKPPLCSFVMTLLQHRC
jgi:hypothetical protein